MKVQAYGHPRGHDEVAVVDGDLGERRFVAVYRTGGRVTGALAVGVPPKAIRQWRQAIAAGAAWHDAVPGPQGRGAVGTGHGAAGTVGSRDLAGGGA
jgi:hypothetical protein